MVSFFFITVSQGLCWLYVRVGLGVNAALTVAALVTVLTEQRG